MNHDVYWDHGPFHWKLVLRASYKLRQDEEEQGADLKLACKTFAALSHPYMRGN